MRSSSSVSYTHLDVYKRQELDELQRKIMQMEIEEAALKKEEDRLSQERLTDLEKELA